ncbi:MAG: ABC transporter permease [Vicinamibacterales bacterium]
MKTKAQGFELRGAATPIRELVTEVWEKRKLIRLLARRDFHVRYRRPSFGLLWVIAVPLIQATVLSIIFTKIIRFSTPGISFPVFMLSGITPWLFFSNTVSGSVNAITGGGNLATKVYFPRAILPLVLVRSNLYGFGHRVAIVVVAALVFRQGIGPEIVLLIPAVALMVLLASAFALLFAAMQVYFRDTSFIVGAAMQAWFWGSAVFFPISRAGDGLLRLAMTINPATGMVYLFRSAIVGWPIEWALIASSLAWSVGLLAVALVLYRRYNRVFTDLL